MARIPRTVPGRLMLGGRLLFGLSFFLAPTQAQQAVGLSPGDNPQAAHWARIFGIRDVALGLGLLAASGDARRAWWAIGMLCDTGDAVAGVVSHRTGGLPAGPRSLVLFTGSALAGVGLGAAALLRDDR